MIKLTDYISSNYFFDWITSIYYCYWL